VIGGCCCCRCCCRCCRHSCEPQHRHRPHKPLKLEHL
jgi:hypothetical protein